MTPTIPDTGTIVVATQPDSLDVGWTINGPESYVAEGVGPRELAELEPGIYTISWGDMAGYVTPASFQDTLVANSILTLTGQFLVTTGTIEIAPTPALLDAGWTLVGPDSYTNTGNGAETLTGLALGDYTVTWDAVTDYVTPASETATLTDDVILTFAASYVMQTGTIAITPSIVDAGWSLAGPDSYTNSGNGAATLEDLVVGDYTITWEAITDHVTPASETAALTADATLTFTGNYDTATGTIEIATIPALLDAGWTLDGPDGYSNTGTGAATLTGLFVGDYTITWGAVTDHETPASETAALTADATLTFTGSYIIQTGTIEIVPSVAGAGWSLSGPDSYSNSGTGAATLADLVVGDYTVIWDDVTGYITPTSDPATLVADATLTFIGVYLNETGTIEIVPSVTDAGWTLSGPNSYSNSGTGAATLTNLVIGDYTVTWDDVTGYITPTSDPATLGADATLMFIGVYTALTGTIDIVPSIADAGWTLTGPNAYSNSGTGAETLTGLMIGDYTVTWDAVAGYVTPANNAATLATDATVTFIGVYTMITGTIEIVPSVTDAGWTLTGPNAYSNSGTGAETLTGLMIGDYTITWDAVTGYDTPASDPATLTEGATVTFIGVYTMITGTIEIVPSVVDAGWSLSGPNAYANSGTGAATLTGLMVGDYTVTWDAVDGYDTPVSNPATLAEDATLTFIGVYVAQTGTVEIAPSVVDAGWSLSGPNAYANSGTGAATLPGLMVGDYTVTWDAATGYATPSPETATLAEDATLTFTGTYVAQTGTVEIAPSVVDAGWSLSGPNAYSNSGTGAETLPGLMVGDYTVTWDAAAGFTTPSPETATLATDATLTLTGTYVPLVGAIDYTDRAAWVAAVGSAPTLTDDYNDAVSDIYPSLGEIARTGYTLGAVMRIDAAPFINIASSPMSANGTPDVLPNTTEFIITFDSSTQTFGGDWACGGGSSNWLINYTTDGGDSGSFNLPSTPSVGEFRGFITANPFTTITFTSTGHWRVMDDMAAHVGVRMDVDTETGMVEVRSDSR